MGQRRARRLPLDVYRPVRAAGQVLERAGVRDEAVLLAVSGGGDSMALLETAGLLATKLHLRLHVGCVDHGLRAQSRDEVALVRAAAARWSAAFHEVRLEPARDDEDTLRRERHAALERVRTAAGCRVLLLGHTRDDQVETILFRFLRGAGLGGLAGMAVLRAIGDEARDAAGISRATDDAGRGATRDPRSLGGGLLVRPLIDVARADLRRLLEARGVAWVEDPTNESPRYARGRLRTGVLPAIEAASGRGALDHLLDVAPRWRADEDFLEREAARWLAYASRRSQGSVQLDATALAEAHPAMRARVLRRWLGDAAGRTTTSREIAAIERWLETSGARGGHLDLPGATLEGAGGRLTVVVTAPEPAGRAGTARGRGGDESAAPLVCPVVDEAACSPKPVLPPSEARVRVPRDREFLQEIPQRCRVSAGRGRGRGPRRAKGLKPNE